MKAIEKLKTLAKKAYGIRIAEKGDSKLLLNKKVLIVVDIFGKIFNEFTECLAQRDDRIMNVLTKNFKKAVERKQDAILRHNIIQAVLDSEKGTFLNVDTEEKQESPKDPPVVEEEEKKHKLIPNTEPEIDKTKSLVIQLDEIEYKDEDNQIADEAKEQKNIGSAYRLLSPRFQQK